MEYLLNLLVVAMDYAYQQYHHRWCRRRRRRHRRGHHLRFRRCCVRR